MVFVSGRLVGWPASGGCSREELVCLLSCGTGFVFCLGGLVCLLSWGTGLSFVLGFPPLPLGPLSRLRGSIGKLWLHFLWPTFWLHCILYFTYRGGRSPPYRYGTKYNVARKLAKRNGAIILPGKLLELLPLPLLYYKVY